mmetsp:Transcript_19260/g.68028  ORF Transcript_19260/g.68028 Transcript_19260/m.68028 type:complete len:200 (+) Transcript_19260:1721-2320(+)
MRGGFAVCIGHRQFLPHQPAAAAPKLPRVQNAQRNVRGKDRANEDDCCALPFVLALVDPAAQRRPRAGTSTGTEVTTTHNLHVDVAERQVVVCLLQQGGAHVGNLASRRRGSRTRPACPSTADRRACRAARHRRKVIDSQTTAIGAVAGCAGHRWEAEVVCALCGGGAVARRLRRRRLVAFAVATILHRPPRPLRSTIW